MEGQSDPAEENKTDSQRKKMTDMKIQSCTCCLHKFNTPCGVLIAGSSQCGKSSISATLLKNRSHMFTDVPKEIIYVYTCWDKQFDDLQTELKSDITFRTDIPTNQELQDIYNRNPMPRALILDDKISAFKNDAQGRALVELAAVITHHCHFTVIYITQNLFHSQIQREISLQCQYLMIFNSPRSHQQLRTLSSQIMGRGGLQYFMESFKKAVARKFGYLLVDVHQATSEKYRLKSCILPTEELVIYLPSK